MHVYTQNYEVKGFEFGSLHLIDFPFLLNFKTLSDNIYKI